ncbi:MAG: signal peptidase II [Verrucomicrobiales bacterium]|nr:signal peptidase II [Verrucomicrobiales bacterium]MCP5558574.1 signal peptidase II [Verrucomicrobiaceae bacterium]
MLRLLLLLSLPLFILDQWSKRWIVEHFELYRDEHEVIPGMFWLHHAANTGVAFGMFNGTKYANYAFGAIAIGALVMITLLYRSNFFVGKLGRLAVALLVSGICGNFLDRLQHGYVVDFLKFDFGFWPFHPWPSFNVADSCVVVAAVCLAVTSFQAQTPSSNQSPPT